MQSRLFGSVVMVAVASIVAAVPARAQEVTAVQAAPAEVRRDADATVDRNLVMPAAETLPKGALAFNSYELFLAGLSYGITDNVQISATTLLPIVEDIPFVLITNLKLNVYRSPRLVLTTMGSATVATENGSTLGGFGLGLVMDSLLDERGRFALTTGVLSQFAFGSTSDDDVAFADGAFLLLWAAISARVHDRVKLIGELLLPGGYTWAGSGDLQLIPEAMIFGYGVRFFGKTLAVDLSFLRPIHPDVDTGELVMGVPWIAFAALF
jgi:hypothetical protein